MNTFGSNHIAVPGIDEDDEENRYPILGHLVWYSLRDVRIDMDDLRALFKKHNLPRQFLPHDIRKTDAFRRATTALSTRVPKRLTSGTFENLMVREVVNNKDEIIRYVIREVTDSDSRRIDYGQIGTLAYYREKEKAQFSIDPRYEEHRNKVQANYDNLSRYYTGIHIRGIVRTMLKSTHPVNVRPAGGVYFMSREHSDLVESLEGFVKDLNDYGTPNTDLAVFESVPMLDIEKQRQLIFDKYEAQTEISVDATLKDLSEILNSGNTPTKSVITKYIDTVKDLKIGIGKYEELLEKDMSIARLKCQFLQDQVKALLDKASVSQLGD